MDDNNINKNRIKSRLNKRLAKKTKSNTNDINLFEDELDELNEKEIDLFSDTDDVSYNKETNEKVESKNNLEKDIEDEIENKNQIDENEPNFKNSNKEDNLDLFSENLFENKNTTNNSNGITNEQEEVGINSNKENNNTELGKEKIVISPKGIETEEEKRIEKIKQQAKEHARKIQQEKDESFSIGIFDRRSITKKARSRMDMADVERFENIVNPPESIIKIRYARMFKELLFALFFTVLIAILHLLMYKSVEIPKIAINVIVSVFAFISIVFLELSYRKSSVNLMLRALEFLTMSFFVMFFTADRYISTNIVTMLLPSIGIGLTFYYLLKVILLEKLLNSEYIRSLSDIREMLGKDANTVSPEIGMLYNKKPSEEKMNLLGRIIEQRNSITLGESKSMQEQKAKELYNDANRYKKKNRTKAEQERFEKFKSRIK